MTNSERRRRRVVTDVVPSAHPEGRDSSAGQSGQEGAPPSAPQAVRALTEMIPLSLVDPPTVPMRAVMDEDYLRALGDSLRANGQLQPIAVFRKGERYEVIAGDCRTRAAKLIGWEHIEAKVHEHKPESVAAKMFAENFDRNDVNDAMVGLWLHEMSEKHGYDLAKMVQVTRRSEAWVNDRYTLVLGDKAVFEAVLNGHIKLGHARVLNRFKQEDYRAMYLEQAVRHGITIGYLEDALRLTNMVDPGTQPQAAPVNGDVPVAPVDAQQIACFVCGGHKDPYNLQLVYIHKWELDHIMKMLASAAGGE